MEVVEAEKLICPYLKTKCITEDCMLWEVISNGKKEIDRKIEPYDMTPIQIRDWCNNIKSDGYENIGRGDGFRDIYVKYEKAFEGYCVVNPKKNSAYSIADVLKG